MKISQKKTSWDQDFEEKYLIITKNSHKQMFIFYPLSNKSTICIHLGAPYASGILSMV